MVRGVVDTLNKILKLLFFQTVFLLQYYLDRLYSEFEICDKWIYFA